MTDPLNTQVQDYWEQETCGTGDEVAGDFEKHSLKWFQQVERNRYHLEPYIHSVAQFTRHYGKKILEIGVGAGTDHLQWARAGCECHGVDLTSAAIETAGKHLELYGFKSDLRHVDAEVLPFKDSSFDLVYSWGVIHHSEKPERIISEIHRILKPGGKFVGMLYNRNSVAVAKLWLRYGLLSLKPWRSFDEIAWSHIESIGTKVYTLKDINALFGSYGNVRAWSIICHSDTHRLPSRIWQFLPDRFGFFNLIQATKLGGK